MITIETVVAIILSLIAGLAIYLEIKDDYQLSKLPDTDSLPPDEREENLKKLACYPYFNGVSWRNVYIAALITTILVTFAFELIFNVHGFLLVFVITFLVFFVFASFYSFHTSRKICSKAQAGFMF